MKSTDLTIGDWVVSPMGHPYKVYELTQEFAYFDNSEGELSDILPKVGIKYDALVPILLTPEILEANGATPEKIETIGEIKGYSKNGCQIREERPVYIDGYRLCVENSVGGTEIFDFCAINEEGEEIHRTDRIHFDCFLCKNLESLPIEYVHQLQHILRLFDANDLADNFKLA